MAVWTADWKSIKGDFIGYVDDANGDVDHLREVVLNKYFVETGTKFVTYGKSSTNRDLKEKAVHYWIKSGNERVNFGGVPFMIIRSNFLECVYGPPRYKGKKGDHEDYFKRSGRKTTRINCPAKINIKEIILFYEEKADIMKRKEMDRLSGRIKWSIYDGTAKFKKAYVFFFSKKDDHVPHDCAFGFGSHLDKRVRQKIRDLVSDGVRNADYIDLEVRRFVKTLFSDYMPSCKNRQFFPSKKSIKSYIHNDAMENDCIMDLLSTISNNSSSDESQEDYNMNTRNKTKRFKRYRNYDTMDANCTLDTLSTVDYNTSSDESQEDYHMSTTNTTNGNKRSNYADLMDANCTLDTLSTVNNITSSDESQEDYHMSTIDTTNSNNSICNESEVQKFNIATNSLKELREVAKDIINLSYQLPQTACLEEEVALLNTIKTYMRKQLIQDDVIVLENGCLPLPRLRC